MILVPPSGTFARVLTLLRDGAAWSYNELAGRVFVPRQVVRATSKARKRDVVANGGKPSSPPRILRL